MKTRIAAACLSALVLLAAGCSESASDLSDSELRDALRETLTEDGTFTDAEANCVIDYLFDNTTRDELNRISDAQTAEELSDADVDLVTDAVFECL